MNNNHVTVNEQTLHKVLSNILNHCIVNSTYEITKLHGGTLGNVHLIQGNAITNDGNTIPFQLVHKTQKSWERYADPLSWRREYDLYQTSLGNEFDSKLRWPHCYHSEIQEDEICLWLEYIKGSSGEHLSSDMYALAAEYLGEFQGRLYAKNLLSTSNNHSLISPDSNRILSNLSVSNFMKQNYYHYRYWPVVSDYIRSDECTLPKHLSEMIITLDDNFERIYSSIEQLPMVLCHRDFWVENIIVTDQGIRIIDWDTSGLGFLGEDIASLIADESDLSHMVSSFHRCVDGYTKGFGRYASVPIELKEAICNMMLIIFGYRFIDGYIHAQALESKSYYQQVLQNIHDIKASI